MLTRHDQHVPGIHRLDVHEGDRVSVLVAHRDLARTVDEVAECAMTVGEAHEILGHSEKGTSDIGRVAKPLFALRPQFA